MKKAAIFVCAALFLSAAAFAATPNTAPVPAEVLAAIVGQPAAGGSCAAPANGALAAVSGPNGLTKALCTATTSCPSGTVSCQGNNSTTSCTAVNRDCSILEPGHVTCDGVTTNCTPACCTTGTIIEKACCRCEATGGCVDCCRCDGGTLAQCARNCSFF